MRGDRRIVYSRLDNTKALQLHKRPSVTLRLDLIPVSEYCVALLRCEFLLLGYCVAFEEYFEKVKVIRSFR